MTIKKRIFLRFLLILSSNEKIRKAENFLEIMPFYSMLKVFSKKLYWASETCTGQGDQNES